MLAALVGWYWLNLADVIRKRQQAHGRIGLFARKHKREFINPKM